MEIEWFQVLVFVTGLAIPAGVLVSAAADTARSEKRRGEDV